MLRCLLLGVVPCLVKVSVVLSDRPVLLLVLLLRSG